MRNPNTVYRCRYALSQTLPVLGHVRVMSQLLMSKTHFELCLDQLVSLKELQNATTSWIELLKFIWRKVNLKTKTSNWKSLIESITLLNFNKFDSIPWSYSTHITRIKKRIWSLDTLTRNTTSIITLKKHNSVDRILQSYVFQLLY